MANHPNFEDFLTNHVCDPMKEGFVELDNHTPYEMMTKFQRYAIFRSVSSKICKFLNPAPEPDVLTIL